MKRLLYILPLCLVLLGCNSIKGTFGLNSTKVEKQQAKIAAVQTALDTVKINKVSEVSELSYGVNNALQRVTNPPIAVVVASELNQRVQTITGLPTLQQQAAMLSLVSDLISNNIAGKSELAAKDKAIESMQAEEQYLVSEKEDQVAKALALAKSTALAADTSKSELAKYAAYWGLGGVILGLKSFLLHSFWTLIAVCVVFLLLRLLAASNPIASTIYGIFESIAATLIHTIYLIVPTALQTFLSSVQTAATPIAATVAATLPSPIQTPATAPVANIPKV